MVELLAEDGLVFVSVPENVTRDVAGNKNLASNFLQVRRCKIFLFLLIHFFLVIVLLLELIILYFVHLVCIYFIHGC